jgi:hypothetical protein
MLAGDFTTVTSPACGRNVTIRATDSADNTPTGFVNNRIDPSLFNPVALNLVKRLPKSQDDCGRVLYGSPTHQNETQTLGKIDWQLSPKHTVIGRVLFTTMDKPIPFNTFSPDNVLTVSTGGRTEWTSSYALGDTVAHQPAHGGSDSARGSLHGRSPHRRRNVQHGGVGR